MMTMNRLPFISTVAAVVALTASVAYWGLQLYKPAQRPIAAVQVLATPPALIDVAPGAPAHRPPRRVRWKPRHDDGPSGRNKA